MRPSYRCSFLAVRRSLTRAAAVLPLVAACSKPPPAAAPAPPEAPPQAVEPPPVLPNAPAPPILVRDVGFSTPQSALHDPSADVYLVSNVDGAALDADGKGFISRLRPDGTVMELRWIDGGSGGVMLDAPKGMAIVGDTLFVADINVVRSFERNSGKPLGKVAIVSASALNDVAAAPDGALFVADMGLGKIKGLSEPQKNRRDAIYTLDARGVVGVLLESPELGQPSSLVADAEGVWVASLDGQLSRIDKAGQRSMLARLPASLDGLARSESGRLIASSRQSSAIYVAKTPQGSELEPAISDLEDPADLGYDQKRRQLIIPLSAQNAVYIQELAL